MRRKGIFTILTAVLMVLAFAGLSFAANQVTLKTTVPNIPKSECYQAGNDTMEFDDLTQIREGDVIQFTLNNKVTVCKSLNMWLRISNDGPGAAQTLDTTADAPVSTTGGTVSDPLTGMWGFLIQATNADTVAGQIITATLQRRLADGSLVASAGTIMTFNGTLATDKLIVKLFDGKIAGTESAFLKPLAATPTLYDTAIVTSDNALCIDTLTQNFPDEYVQNTPDSLPVNVAQRLTFSGDYRIAHILSELVYSLYTCKGYAPGFIRLGSSGQSSSSCTAFDFETAGGNNGYCTGYTGNKFILQASQPYELTQYTLRMEILVNGLTGEHGVYWSNTAPVFGHYATSTDACAGLGTAAFAGQSYLRGDGSTTAVPVAPVVANCSGVAAGAKAVRIDTTATNLFALNDSFLYVNFPEFNYNLSEVQSGDVVSVRVTVSKSTCGVVGTFTIPIGTFGCPVSASSGKLLFTYFTDLTAGDFWNGIAIINNTSAGGTASLTAYQKDGAVGTATVSVPAKGMYVNLLESITWSGSGLGGQQCYITVTTDYGSPDGFGMIAKETTGESMGYLPRQTF